MMVAFTVPQYICLLLHSQDDCRVEKLIPFLAVTLYYSTAFHFTQLEAEQGQDSALVFVGDDLPTYKA